MGNYNIVSASSLIAGQPEDVSPILANFQAIAAVLNGGIDDTNIAATAGISLAKTSPKITTSPLSGGPPALPANSDIWIATGIGPNDERWAFQYNSGSASTYKWDFIGGSALSGFVNAFAATTADGAWKNYGLGITLSRAGDYRVRWSGSISNTTAVAGSVFAHFALGTGSIVPVAQTSSQVTFEAQVDMRTMSLDTIVFNAAAGQGVFEITLVSAGLTVQLGNRSINVTPIRII